MRSSGESWLDWWDKGIGEWIPRDFEWVAAAEGTNLLEFRVRLVYIVGN